jgi:hypothetical protein
MARRINRDAVVKRTGSIRQARESKAREATQNRELSDDERVDLLRMSFFQSALPDLPQIDGYHTCWLTTTNARDPIVGRERLGYQLLRKEDLPGWEHSAQKGGQYDGCIMVNEMVAAKISLGLYQKFMAELHHREPLREEERIVADTHSKKNEAISHGSVLIEAPGIVALGKDPGTPDFTTAPPPSSPMSGDQTFDEADAAWVDE